MLFSYLVSYNQWQHVLGLTQFSQGKCNMWILGSVTLAYQCLRQFSPINVCVWVLEDCTLCCICWTPVFFVGCLGYLQQSTSLAESSAWNHHVILSSIVRVSHFGLVIWHWYASLSKNNALRADGMALAVQYTLPTSTHSWLAAVSWKTGILPCKGHIAIHRQSETSAAKWSQMNISC